MRFRIEEDYWWDDSTKMIFYRVHDRWGAEIPTNGTPHSVEEAAIYILEYLGHEVAVKHVQD